MRNIIITNDGYCALEDGESIFCCCVRRPCEIKCAAYEEVERDDPGDHVPVPGKITVAYCKYGKFDIGRIEGKDRLPFPEER